MNEAKIFHVDDNGLVEGEALGRISVMLIADYRELQEQSQRNLNRAIDAETELRKAKDVAKRLIEVIMRDEDTSAVGSPQHCHNVAGKWDADGSDCEECAAFEALRELAK